MTTVAIIVGLVLITDSISDNTAVMTNTYTTVNQTVAWTNTTVLTLNGKLATNFIATNQTNGVTVPATNYTVNNNVILADGTLGSTLTEKGGVFIDRNVNISYTWQPLGYVPEGGGRAIVDLIVLFCVIAIFVVALVPTLRNGILDLVGK